MKKYFNIICVVIFTAIFFGTTASAAWLEFGNDHVDTNYNFSKLKTVFVAKVNTSGIVFPSGKKFSTHEEIMLETASKRYLKKMKCKLAHDTNTADAVLEITINDWKSEFHHHVPERKVHEKAEYIYEGYERHRPPPPHRRDRHKQGLEHRPPSLFYKYKRSSTWFPGSTKRMVRPERDVVYSAYDVYRSEVKALFELHDAKTNAVIMNREGSINSFQNNYQAELFSELCREFCKNFRKIVKQANKTVAVDKLE